MELEELINLAEEKIKLGNTLIEKLEVHQSVDGVKKIQRKIRQEIKFLEKIIKNKSIKVNNIICSNLTYFDALVKALIKVDGLRSVDYPVPNCNTPKTLRIDLVCDDGATWVKIIARNSKSIKDAVEGNASYGVKTILDQAVEIVEAAKMNQHFYQTPRILFLFTNPIDDELSMDLYEIGIEAKSLMYANFLEKTIEINVLNLDITTLIAYVSNVCNGGQHNTINDDILQKQAFMEQKQPIKSILDDLFYGKILISCETAVNSFMEIINVLGGNEEKRRSEELLKRIKILPDVEIVDELSQIPVSGQVKKRSLKIFSFGLKHKAITVTANEGFYRSVKMHKIDIPVFLHGARALTELKELR